MNRSGRIAREPSSGEPAASGTTRPGDPGPAVPPIGSLVSSLLFGTGVGFLAYRCVVDRLADDGHVAVREAMNGGTVRAEVLLWGGVALVALALVAVITTWSRRRAARGSLGAGLFALGITWFVWSSLDMHVLDVYGWRGSGEYSLVDLVYHGAGLVVAAVGYAMVIPGFRVRDG